MCISLTMLFTFLTFRFLLFLFFCFRFFVLFCLLTEVSCSDRTSPFCSATFICKSMQNPKSQIMWSALNILGLIFSIITCCGTLKLALIASQFINPIALYGVLAILSAIGLGERVPIQGKQLSQLHFCLPFQQGVNS